MSKGRRVKSCGPNCQCVMDPKKSCTAPKPRIRVKARKWSDGGGTGLVDWTGDLGPGLQVDHTKVAEEK